MSDLTCLATAKASGRVRHRTSPTFIDLGQRCDRSAGNDSNCMIERYSIKFAPAVNQKELVKIMNTGEGKFHPVDLKKMKARIEFIGDFEDVRARRNC